MAATTTPTRARRSRRGLVLGVVFLLIGGLLLAAAGSYYAYGFFASRNLDNLNATAEPNVAETITLPPSETHEQPSVGAQYLYPGSLLPARQWADPRGAISLAQPDLAGFTPISNRGQPLISGVVGRADRIVIPQLTVDAEVVELSIINLETSAAYETPKFTVGHIPTTPNPGSEGNGWYFGHLESPIQGEGNVFSRLTQVPDLLRDGEEVHVILGSGEREYLYLASGVRLMHESELTLDAAEGAQIALVTCYPRLKYDHRLIVTAQLIGFRDVVSTES